MAKISDQLTTEPKVQITSLLTYALAAMLRKLPPAFFLGARYLNKTDWSAGIPKIYALVEAVISHSQSR